MLHNTSRWVPTDLLRHQTKAVKETLSPERAGEINQQIVQVETDLGGHKQN